MLAVLAAVAALVVTGCTPDGQAPPAAKTTAPRGPVLLTFSVYGAPQVITAYTKIAAAFTAAHPETVVNIRPFDSHDEAMAATEKQIKAGSSPDLFLADDGDLPGLMAEHGIRRVDELLGKRQVDFGDGFERDALEAFSSDAALQCMPTQISPMVVYYNTSLVDLSTAATPGRKPVEPGQAWWLDEFAQAAQQASHGGRRGVYVAPELEQVAPFVWSGGGTLVDSPTDPTHLNLSDGSSSAAIQKLLQIVRNPRITFSRQQLERRSALQRFRAGKLGMILGYRDLTPLLRQQQNLLFDVMPIPKINTSANVGHTTAACIGKDTEHAAQTADFLAYLVSDPSMRTLAETGYVMPTNLDVTNSDAFLQPNEMPQHAAVFSDQVRASQPLPSTPVWDTVRRTAALALTHLFYDPVIDPLDDRLKAIDDNSADIFSPPTPSASPSASPTS